MNVKIEGWKVTLHNENGDRLELKGEFEADFFKEYENKQLILHIVSDLCCASCGYQMKFDKSEDKWGCAKCGHTSQHYR